MSSMTITRAGTILMGLALAAWLPAHAGDTPTPTKTAPTAKQATTPKVRTQNRQTTGQPQSSQGAGQAQKVQRQQRLRNGQCTGQGAGRGQAQAQRPGAGRATGRRNGKANGPGNGTGNQGVRPLDGTGYGSGARTFGGPGSPRCDGSGRAAGGRRGGGRRGGRG